MTQTIKELRIKIDGLYQLTKDLKPHSGKGIKFQIELGIPGFNSNEVNEAARSLKLAKAWLGKLLAELGNKTPYSSGKKEVKDIEPTADTYPKEMHGYEIGTTWRIEGINREPNHIEKVDWLRSEIQKVIDEVYKILEINSRTRLTGESAWRYLCEAKMWLGFEFQRIREEKT